MDGDVQCLREALQVLVEGNMDAEVSAHIGVRHGERIAGGSHPPLGVKAVAIETLG